MSVAPHGRACVLCALLLAQASAFTSALAPVRLGSAPPHGTRPRGQKLTTATPRSGGHSGKRTRGGEGSNGGGGGAGKIANSLSWRLYNVEVSLSDDVGKDSVAVDGQVKAAINAAARKHAAAALDKGQKKGSIIFQHPMPSLVDATVSLPLMAVRNKLGDFVRFWI